MFSENFKKSKKLFKNKEYEASLNVLIEMLNNLDDEDYKQKGLIYGGISDCYFEKSKQELQLDKYEEAGKLIKKSLIYANCSSAWFEKEDDSSIEEYDYYRSIVKCSSNVVSYIFEKQKI